jgi:hypothetical protein
VSGPYASEAERLWDAGWRGVLPLPPRAKKSPPDGYTGWSGRDPSYPDLLTWVEDQGEGNIALHLPPGVVGIDIDNYGDKRGAEMLAQAEALWGPLPPTWKTTSRDDGVSGIRLFRCPVGLRWPGTFGSGTETIHSGHRYVVAPPSIHPTTEKAYRWFGPDGVVSMAPPLIADLPKLPTRWVVGLTQGREAKVLVGAGMSDEDIEEWLHTHAFGDGQPCERMGEAIGNVLDAMHDGAHESILGPLLHVVGLGARGHLGLLTAVKQLRREFIHVVSMPGREHHRTESEAAQEWKRALFGAIDKVVAERREEDAPAPDGDPCQVGEPSVVERAWEAPASYGPEVSAPGADSPRTTDEEGPGHEDQGESEEHSGPTPAERRAMDIEERRRFLSVDAAARELIAAENAPPLRIMGFTEFLDAPRPEPVVHRMLYVDSLSRIFGKPGCGKSFLALDLAFHVALGRDWGGHPVKQGPVVYVMAEGQRVNTVRAAAWMERHEVKPSELEGKFWAVPDKVLLTKAASRPFVEAIRELNPVLIILDTQNAMQVGEENSASDTRDMRDALDEMRHATNACVTMLGHTGKGDQDSARGSNAAEGAMDTEVLVKKDEDAVGGPPRITVEVTRDKADENGTTWEFRLRHHPLPDQLSGAVLVPVSEDDTVHVPERRDRAPWVDEDVVMPVEIEEGFTGRGRNAMPYVFKYLSTDANPRVGDPSAIGVTLVQTVAAVKAGAGFERSSVSRCWSWLRSAGYIGPADEKDTNTTGKHIWLRR